MPARKGEGHEPSEEEIKGNFGKPTSINDLLTIAREVRQEAGMAKSETEPAPSKEAPQPQELPQDEAHTRPESLSAEELDKQKELKFIENQKQQVEKIKAKSRDRGGVQYYELTPYLDRLTEEQKNKRGIVWRKDEAGNLTKWDWSRNSSDIVIGHGLVLSPYNKNEAGGRRDVQFDNNPDGYLKASQLLDKNLEREIAEAKPMPYELWKRQQRESKVEFPSEEAAKATFETEKYMHDFVDYENGQWRRLSKDHLIKCREMTRDHLEGFSQAAFEAGDLQTAVKGYKQLDLLDRPEIASAIKEKMLALKSSKKPEDKMLLQKGAAALLEIGEAQEL